MGPSLVMAGMGSTPDSMDVILGLLVNYQDVQERAYQDIQSVIGQRTPTIEDRENLAYVEAVILESLRYSTMSPAGFAHCTSENVELCGYLIPKGTLVFPNNWSIGHDPR